MLDSRRGERRLGYSSWGPGQLEGEIAAGAWLPVPFDKGILFDVEVAARWERAYGLLGLTPAGMMSMPERGGRVAERCVSGEPGERVRFGGCAESGLRHMALASRARI
ncbi:MAG TPA: YqgE/AlgH family protein [Polyangiaceae bacterium]|nr:YqgE/AlgH family protein [Polyangiaceae bacterium]